MVSRVRAKANAMALRLFPIKMVRHLPARGPSSIQFSLDFSPLQIERFPQECCARRLHTNWFGLPAPTAFTKCFGHRHRQVEQAPMPQSKPVLPQPMDLRTLPPLTPEDCRLIVQVTAGLRQPSPVEEDSELTP